MTKLEKQVQDAKGMKDEAKNLLIKWEFIISNAHHVQPVSTFIFIFESHNNKFQLLPRSLSNM